MQKTASLEITPSHSIQWKQLWSLASLYASIVIGWIAYHNYQPKLLVKFNFTDFSFLLTLASGVILVVTPLVAGRLGDRYRFKKGHRLPIISTGISFAAMIFMAVAFTLLSNPGEVFKWVLPVLIVLWLVAMSIFTSPALSTLELFTPVDQLPSAMAILTIVGNLIYALEPVIVDIIDYIGAPLTFIAGGTVVFLSGYALQKNASGLFNIHEFSAKEEAAANTHRSRYVYIFILGIALGFATTVLFNFFPEVLQASLKPYFDLEGKWLIVGILLISAIISWPATSLIKKYGMEVVFWGSLALIGISMSGVIFLSDAWIVLIMALLFAFTFTTLSVSSLPLAIKNAGYYEKVFCVGIFFSGVELPEAIIESILNYQ